MKLYKLTCEFQWQTGLYIDLGGHVFRYRNKWDLDRFKLKLDFKGRKYKVEVINEGL